MVVIPPDKLTPLQRYVADTGLRNFKGKTPAQMSDDDCRASMRWLRDYGRISYIPSII